MERGRNFSSTKEPTPRVAFGYPNIVNLHLPCLGMLEGMNKHPRPSLAELIQRLVSSALTFVLTLGLVAFSPYVEESQAAGVGFQQMAGDFDGLAGSSSGGAVSLSHDGLRLAIGSFGMGAGGQVSIYDWDGSAWSESATIDGEAAEDQFGRSVALSGDGSRVAVGAPYNDIGGSSTNSGHVQIYEYSNSAWVQVGSDIDGEAEDDLSGWSVALSDDGSRVAIGALFNDGATTQSNGGHVRIYEFRNGAWVQLGQDLDAALSGDRFGESVALNGIGTIVAIGAPNNDGNGANSGQVRVLEWDGLAWSESAIINGEAAGDRAGQAVSLSSDGSRVAIGANQNFGSATRSGHVRVYERAAGSSSWDRQVGADIDGEAEGDQLGFSVALNDDGTKLAVGAHLNDGVNGADSGHVRIYEYSNSAWVQVGSDIDGEGANDNSGSTVALNADGNIVAIGAPGNDGNGSNSGHVRVFQAAASLIDLNLSEGPLSPSFSSSTNAYSATVLNGVTSVAVTPTSNTLGSSITVNGASVASGSASSGIPLSVGTNTITVVVSASGFGTTTYTVTVTRESIVFNDRVCDLGDPNSHSTSATAFEISDADQLWEVTDCVSTSATIYFELTDDIDVSAAAYAPTSSPIGFSTSAVAYSFSGVLDGNGHGISGISMSSSTDGVGLFAYLHAATITDLSLAGALTTTVSFGNNTTRAAGALATRSLGGLRVERVTNSATVTGDGFVGGIVGYSQQDAHFDRVVNLAEVVGSREYVGGLVGYVQDDLFIDTSRNAATVSGAAFVGGHAGYVHYDTIITSSENIGVVSGSAKVGGLIGEASRVFSANASSNTGAIVGSSEKVGGLVGHVDAEATLSSSFNSGEVSGTNSIGGLVGSGGGNSVDMLDSYNTGTIIASGSEAGGLAGYVRYSANITSSHNTGSVSGASQVGGLLGRVFNSDTSIHESFNSGAVTGSADRVGGLVGQARGLANLATAYNTGTISAVSYVGGLIGQADSESATVSSSYNVGSVTGSGDRVGGLLGSVTGDATLSSVYNAGAVTGSSLVDGLSGVISGSDVVSAAYTSVASSFASTSTIADMKLASTYTGFDFNNVWGFGSCTDNQGFPMLRTFASLGSYFAFGCGLSTAPSSGVVQTPGQSSGATQGSDAASAPSYDGKVIDAPQAVVAGQTVAYAGRKLNLVTSAQAGSKMLTVVSTADELLILDVPASMPPGVYDLVLQSSFGTLTFQQGLTVLEAQDQVVESEAGPKLTVGSFKGYVAIYTKGYEGAKLSAKIAGKWLVVEELKESWKTFNYSRTVRFTGAGYSIKVHLYINGQFVRIEELTTR